ncbi:MAG: hypothetical protein MUC76_14140 [Spirochaetes bacterium]|nr:hypothetical protein [Spirochaetota bacterium]
MRSPAIALSIAMTALVLGAACGAGSNPEDPAFPAELSPLYVIGFFPPR